MAKLPRYPIYVISKGRSDRCLTARFLTRDEVPFSLVVEPQEADAYTAEFGLGRLLVLPFSNLGLGSIPARNWVWDHAMASGAERHWILDDNIRQMYRRWHARSFPCWSGTAYAVVEDLADRYENVAIAGHMYYMFCPNHVYEPPFRVNCHVYSSILLLNSLPFRWRGRYNEDTDLCLQAIATGWCTIQCIAFNAEKMNTMSMRGGNSDELYQGDGRLRMARSLERLWPGVVKVTRRFGRPQHMVNWTKFDNQLRLKPEVDLAALEPDEYGLELVQVKPIQNRAMQILAEEAGARVLDG